MWPRDAPLFDQYGVEETFAVNLVNQALLFFLLHSNKHLAADYRIITISSQLHDPRYAPAKGDIPAWIGPDGVARAKDRRLANPATRYTTSKLADVMFGYALHRHIQQFASKRGKAIVYDPAYVPGTGLTRGEGDCLKCSRAPWLIFWGRRQATPEVCSGSRSPLHPATVQADHRNANVYAGASWTVYGSISSRRLQGGVRRVHRT